MILPLTGFERFKHLLAHLGWLPDHCPDIKHFRVEVPNRLYDVGHENLATELYVVLGIEIMAVSPPRLPQFTPVNSKRYGKIKAQDSIRLA